MNALTFHSGLRPLNDELDYRVNQIEGEVPAWLRGSFFRNGPGRLEVGQTRMGHWFDGDGMVCAFRFREDGVHFMNRYVRTPKYLRESALNKVDCRGFGTQRPGGLLANLLRPPANPANTSLIWHGGKLLALNEGGCPFELDPHTLETRGEYRYAGELKPHNTFSAHGKIDPATGEYINFGVAVSGLGWRGLNMALTLFRIDRSGRLVQKSSVPVDYFPFCHDCALTPEYVIFSLGSIRMRELGKVILGTRTLAESIAFDPAQPMRILVLNWRTGEVVMDAETAAGAIIHFGNARQEQGTITVDAMFADNFDANDALRDMQHASRLAGGEFRRYRLDLQNQKVSYTLQTRHNCEFPQWDTRKTGLRTDYTWCAASFPNGADSFFNGLLRVKADDPGQEQSLILPQGCFASEPMFVPRPGGEDETDGVLLDVVYNADTGRSELWILDAGDLSRVLARALLPHHVPHQFHGCFAADIA